MAKKSNKSIPSIFKGLRIIDPKKKVVFCKKCVLSNQRPRTMFNEDGVCAPCLYAEFKRTSIDWDKREKELEELCDKHRSKDGSWDVVVPGSGGKDSSYVSVMLKEKFGMHPLTVTWASAITTDIGKQNLDAFIRSGFDNVLGTPDGKVHQKLSQITFKEFGDNFLAFGYGQLNFPIQTAVRYKIPLVMFGEDGDVEYGGSFERYDTPKFDFDYMVKTKFTSYPPEYWKSFGMKPEDLQRYSLPPLKEIKSNNVEVHYFSYYDFWDPQKHYDVAKKSTGFKPNPEGRSEGTYTDFASLDDKTDGFHYYMAFIKFGTGRATSDAQHQIRDGVLTRDEGVDLVRQYDGEFPTRDLKEFLEYMEMDMNTLYRTIDKFRKPLIWKKINDEWKLRQQVTKLK